MRSVFCVTLLVSMAAFSGDVLADPDPRTSVPSAPASDDALLQGSPTALAGENGLADNYHLERFKDFAAIKAAIDRGELVAVAPNATMVIAKELGEHDRDHAQYYAYARPWVKAFLDDLAHAPTLPASTHFFVTSLVRSEAYQAQLRRTSVTAASGSSPERRSSHLTGSTVDITTKDMPEALKAWMRVRLAAMERAGLVYATEEKFGSLCFHIMVHPEYVRLAQPVPSGP